MLIRFLLKNAAMGVLAGWALASAIVCLDVGSLGTLIDGSPDGMLALVLLMTGFAVTFGSAAAGTAVFLLPREDEPRR